MKNENYRNAGRADGQHSSHRMQRQNSKVFDGRLNGSLPHDSANRAEGLGSLGRVGPGPSGTYIRRVFQNVRT
ncbi:MAG TPA: hypothetical protein VFQ24_01970 [Terriglobia bacterium]|nr:hypothetical protein [Terriglobia bacterium]